MLRPEILLMILGMTVATYLTRVTFLVLFGRITLPPWLIKGLRYIPLGIMSAFVVPSLVIPQGKVDLSLSNYYLLAGIIAALVAMRWKNVFLSMGSGVGALLMLRFWLG